MAVRLVDDHAFYGGGVDLIIERRDWRDNGGGGGDCSFGEQNPRCNDVCVHII